MTNVFLLETLKTYTNDKTKDLIMPVKMQKGDTQPSYRAANVYNMQLPEASSSERFAPYIIHQIIETNDEQTPGNEESSSTLIRSVFCTYNENPEEGSMMLLNLMERVRISLLTDVVIGKQFMLDLSQKVQCAPYADNTWPYYLSEMITAWILPPIKREVK